MTLALLAGFAAALTTQPADTPAVARRRSDPALAVAHVQAMRITQPVAIDGMLSDAIWASAQRISTLQQRDPIEGAAPTESTVVWVAYDDAALYVAARMYDSHPDSIVARLARRDQGSSSDEFTVYLDTYHDRRSGFWFVASAAGTLRDGTLENDDWDDDSWDGVWDAKVGRDSLGWTAEFRIPYSQLRFNKAEQYVWGVNFRRSIARKNERDFLVYRPKNASGFVSRFPDLMGIERITPPRRLEVMPYTTGKAEFAPHAPGDPFNDGSRLTPGMGVDFKTGVAGLTLTGTVNPDFGQVEVDPAVVNLSDFETFFSEKRPFFIEGSSIFNFGQGGATNYWGFNWSGPRFFYTRRIGRSPQGGVPQGSDPATSFADMPSATSILGAMKLTGKLGSSWNVGALSALTDREFAQVDTSANRFRQEVEPQAFYGVFRAQKEFPEGRQGLGFLATADGRAFKDASLRDGMNSHSYAGGVDGWTFLDKSKTWVVTGWVGGTMVQGDSLRLLSLQQNPNHYFQRPDARHLHVDSNATALRGWAARFYVNKQKGDWFSNSAIGIISPGFDVADLGFMGRTGLVNSHFGAGHDWNQPGKVFRSAELGAAVFGNWNWDGDLTWTGIFHFGNVQFLNYYGVNWSLAYNPSTVNDRRTRGGPLSLNKPGYQVDVGFNSDSRKAWTYMLQTGTYQSIQDRNWYVAPMVQWLPASSVSVSVSPQLSYEATPVQYVTTIYNDTTAVNTYNTSYVFARLRQTELSAGIRMNWTYSPKVSLQLYAQPLISAGKYDQFRRLARPRSFDFDSTAAPYDPDFNFKSLRGNAVLRWEYLPGSTMFLVWTQSRSDFENIGDFNFGNSLHRLAQAKPDNIFLVKFTYWWNP